MSYNFGTRTNPSSSTFKLPAPVSELAAAKDMLMVFTADCMVRVM